MNLSWLSQAGLNYRVKFKTNLNTGLWWDLVGDVSATGSSSIITDGTAGNAGLRYYRAQLLQ